MKLAHYIAFLLLSFCLSGCNEVAHEHYRISIPLLSHNMALAATVVYPQGRGPFPVAIVNHGTSNAKNRAKFGYWQKPPLINALVKQGFAVLVPIRQGFGATGGEYRAGVAACGATAPDYFQAGLNAAEDIMASVNYLPMLDRIDLKRVVLIGHSAGGFASLAAASIAGNKITAVANFAGGRGGSFKSLGVPCHSDALADAVARYARTSSVPTLWHYAVNDRFFGPDVARVWFNAFQNAGGEGELIMAPAYKKNGHSILIEEQGITLWMDEFLDFWNGVINNVQ